MEFERGGEKHKIENISQLQLIYYVYGQFYNFNKICLSLIFVFIYEICD